MRGTVVIKINELTADWEQAAAKHDRQALSRIIDAFGALRATGDELLLSDASRRINAKSVEGTRDSCFNPRIFALRSGWKAAYARRDAARNLLKTREVSDGWPEDWATAVFIADSLATFGFEHRVDLDGAGDDTADRMPSEARQPVRDIIRAITKGGNQQALVMARPLEQRRVSTIIDQLQGQKQQSITEKVDETAELVQLRKKARWETVIESAPQSINCYMSALRSWGRFCNEVLHNGDDQMPPRVEDLVLWARRFTNAGTFQNYLSGLSWACDLVGVDTIAFRDPLLRRAKTALKKKQVRRPRRAITLPMVRALMNEAYTEGDAVAASLYCLAYAFLFRVQSELRPIALLSGGSPQEQWLLDSPHKSVLSISGDEAVLWIRNRKNTREPTTMRRKCWCSRCPVTCPYHCALRLLATADVAPQPFLRPSVDRIVKDLRRRVVLCGTLDAAEFTLHCFRRGHARDLCEAGNNLAVILRAGGWTSSAFLAYLDLQKLSDDAVAATADQVDDLSSDSD